MFKVTGETTLGELTAFLNNAGIALEVHSGRFAAVRLHTRLGHGVTHQATGHDLIDALQKAVKEHETNRS